MPEWCVRDTASKVLQPITGRAVPGMDAVKDILPGAPPPQQVTPTDQVLHRIYASILGMTELLVSTRGISQHRLQITRDSLRLETHGLDCSLFLSSITAPSVFPCSRQAVVATRPGAVDVR